MSGLPRWFGFERAHSVWVALLASMLIAGAAGAQTNPTAQTLPYTQDFRTLAAGSTTYPAGWQGWINGAPGAALLTTGPTANQALLASSSASTTTGGVHNYNGKIGPLDNGTNDFGLCFAIATSGFSGVVVSYEMATIRNPYDGTTNTRVNEIALQYRVGTSGSWTTLSGSEYQNNTTTQTGSGVVTPQKIEYRSVTLPATCDNQAVVQLRWAQREISGAGSRPSFAIDNVAVQQPPPGGQATALELDGVNDYVTFGQAPALGVSTFTIETWFMRTGTGVTTSTGSLGIGAIVPLMAKGFAEADGSTVDMNFILGINTTGNVIAADYEEGTGQTSPGLNHPISGVTPILNNVWYHAAATFDGTALRVYLNGVLEGTNTVGANRLPQSASIQHATLGTALNSTGGIGTQPLGLFQGRLDEARIWNVARAACDIVNAMNLELTSGTGLVARWGMSDGAGVVLGNSLSTPNGILMNGPTWVAGSPFNAPTTPAAPGGLAANATDAAHVQLAWTDAATTESGYEVERSTTGPSGTFTLLATLAANATGYTDTPLSPSTEYCYQVRAISVCSGSSATSAVACATTPAPAPPNPPTGLAAVALTYSQINLSWTDNSSDETSFEVERSTDGGATFAPLATLAANTTAYSDIGLSASSAYCYRVRATSGIGPSGDAGPACATTPAFANMALDLAGGTYVTFGDPNALDLAQFTVECWFMREGTGTPSTTGTNGISDAVPLVAHGAPQAEGGTPPVDMNFMLGISNGTGALCADFEEGAGGTGPIGLNHPILGQTRVEAGWHHAAVTYDGSTWKLYLDGILDGATDINQPVCSNTIQQASLGTMLTSTGGTNGFFDGRLDEVRIWSLARTQAEIRSTANAQLASPQPGLVARWSLDEGSGTTVAGSAGTAVNGAVVGPNYSWVTPGGSYDLTFNEPPLVPVLVSPPDHATGTGTSPSLDVSVTDPEGAPLTVTYYGRPLNAAAGPDFTVAVLPDAQYYTAQTNGGSIGELDAQNNWIVANRAIRNIVYTVQLGDCTDTNTPAEWTRASSSFGLLENPLTTGMPEGMPYGVSVGNHDQTPNGDPTGTANYNAVFGESRFASRTYYRGHYGSDNDNWYETFSASGMDFIVISLEYDPGMTASSPALVWADGLLSANSDRRAILVSHFIINTGNPAGFGPQGQAIYNALKGHSNLFLMLCGHVPGEGRRQDALNGTTVHTLLSDYQSRTHGGDGWMRILEFSPANDVVRVRTYSPTLDQFEADADSSSQFTLAYPMTSNPAFQVLGTTNGVPSGSVSSLAWPGLANGAEYEWYARVSDGNSTTTSPVWSFTTQAASNYTLDVTVSPPGGGTVAKSPDQPTYPAGTPVQLTATPAPGYAFAGWSGGATGSANPVTVTITGNTAVTASFTPTTLNVASAISPAEVVTTVHPTVAVPVRISRSVATPILGFSVDFAVASPLATTRADVHEGTFLQGVNPATSFQVVDHGDGHFTADGVTLGPPCGAVALDGLLCTIDVTSAAAGGTGTVTIEAVRLRDCANDPLPAAVGAAATVVIDRTLPAVAVTSPNGGEAWLGGSAHAITWTASDAAGIAADGIDLAYSTDGVTWTPIVAGRPHTGTYDWTLPAIVTATARVRVTARDANGNPNTDASDAAFAIQGATTTTLVVTPDPGVHEEAVTLAATVAPGVAGGAVEFFEGSTPLGTAPVAGGVATLELTTLAVGMHTFHAAYSGDALHAASASADVVREVKAKIIASAGPHGSIDPSGTVLVSLDATPAFTFVADAGYHVASVTVDAAPAPPTSPFVFAPVSGNHTIAVAFDVNPPVAPIASLEASQVPGGNDNDGTIKVRLHWGDAIPPGSAVEVYRARFGGYPEYDDAGGVEPPAPITPPVPGGAWELTAVQASDGTDEVSNGSSGYGGRDVWTYVAFVRDPYGTHSPPSNLTVGRPNYLLGDVSDGTPQGLGRGNNVVDGADVSALGASYGLSGPSVAPVAYLDVGPTQDYSVATRPRTDNAIDFEDLVIFAINYDSGPGPQARPAGAVAAGSGVEQVTVEAPALVAAGDEFTVRLRLQGTGRVQALSAALGWRAGVVEPIGVGAGAWLTQLGGVALSAKAGAVDVALLGTQGPGLSGEGEVAVVRFRALAAGDPGVALAGLRGRDAGNREVALGSAVEHGESPLPARTRLEAAYPNPFRERTTIGFSLARGGEVTVRVLGVDGRLVRTLASGRWVAGVHQLSWDGRDEAGHAMSAGIYFVHLTSPEGQFTKRISFLR